MTEQANLSELIETKPAVNQLLRELPAMGKLLEDAAVEVLAKNYSFSQIKKAMQQVLATLRKQILLGEITDVRAVASVQVFRLVSKALEKEQRGELMPVINGTGVILHTNLGRAVLAPECSDALMDITLNYSNLEYDLESGKRGFRGDHIEKLLTELTGAEAAHVVNNNAAAVMLVLNTFCKEREVVISRGELVEVGGSFRIPEIMKQSQTKLCEVGATNRTHLFDYEQAINAETAAVIKVHTSNFHVVGFTHQVPIQELKPLCEDKGIYLFNDLGSGLLCDMQRFGLPYEPTVKEALEQGSDLVMFSGDKLLGASQAGIILGKKSLVDKLKKNQLSRALRIDKLTLVALEQTLKLYLDEEEAVKRIPLLRMLGYETEELIGKAQRLQHNLEKLGLPFQIEIVDSEAKVGGGAYANATLPSKALQFTPQNSAEPKFDVIALERSLRLGKYPIIGRIQDQVYLLDMRTIAEEQFNIVVDACKNLL